MLSERGCFCFGQYINMWHSQCDINFDLANLYITWANEMLCSGYDGQY
jgi:hypothetical protein